ncbi:MAG: hypothetical protein KBC98_01845 [Candidatus Pacebacteria bacterium]|nr:hypothetical protein [Candidatus Paceibacterota bacterium]
MNSNYLHHLKSDLVLAHGISIFLKIQLDSVISKIESERDTMANHIMPALEEMIRVSEEIAPPGFKGRMEKYFETTFDKKDEWAFPGQVINLAIIDVCQYDEAFVALPEDKEVTALLFLKIEQMFGVKFTKLKAKEKRQLISKGKKGKGEDFSGKEAWPFYRVTFSGE